MLYRITKEFSFSASHQLSHLEPSHPCARLHGHNYNVEIELSSASLDERGFVIDYNDLARFKGYIDSTLDHRHLNDALGGSEQTTAERLAAHLYAVALGMFGPSVSACRVRETPKTCAEFRP